MEREFLEELKRHNFVFKTNEQLSKYTTLRIGGPAKYLVNIKNIDELIKILQLVKVANENLLVLGAGSNILISDNGFDGVVIKLKDDFCKIEIDGQFLAAYAAAMLPVVIKTAVEASLSGLEDLFGIPGTVGGATVMNAGTKVACIADNVEYVEVIKIDTPEDGIIRLKKDEVKFGYRTSSLEDKYVVIKTVFKLKEDDKEKLKSRINEVLLERMKTQPLDTFNAGCIFKNPQNTNLTSAKLIEECGLKGYSVGGAYISEKHANFIINRENATAEDFIAVINHVIKTVKAKFNIELEPEIKLIGLKLNRL